MRKGAPLLHRGRSDETVPAGFSGNVIHRFEYGHGDVDKGFEQADLVIEREFRTAAAHQGYIEPNACLASVGPDGIADLWVCTQGHYMVRNTCAGLLGMDASRLRVTASEIGGGFGGKTTVFIEPVRGAPLVTILFMASILLPLFLPENVRVDRILRVLIGMTVFAAAYMAENVRGGLAAIPPGQYEAAKAVGLNGFQTMLLIVLPQALRTVIPAIVGQFIALFMDTTLAVIVGLLELLAIGKAIVQGNPLYLRLQAEVYIFIALLFWVFTFSMSYASRRVESALGVGKR
jgi:ABC-type amino acid transport system permease subunit